MLSQSIKQISDNLISYNNDRATFNTNLFLNDLPIISLSGLGLGLGFLFTKKKKKH